MCDCGSCQYTRRIEAAINPQTAEARAALDDLFGQLAGAEMDATYWRLKFQGRWPDGARRQHEPQSGEQK